MTLQIYIRPYIPGLDNTVVTVHARFDEQLPERSQGYFDEIDNHLATEMLEKAEKIDDYMYLVELKHSNGPIPYFQTRVVERRGLIVAYHKLARSGNTTDAVRHSSERKGRTCKLSIRNLLHITKLVNIT